VWQENRDRWKRQLKPFATINATAPQSAVWIRHVSDPLAISGEVDFTCRNSGKKWQELVGPTVINNKFTTRQVPVYE
jgi:hypothetical protein